MATFNRTAGTYDFLAERLRRKIRKEEEEEGKKHGRRGRLRSLPASFRIPETSGFLFVRNRVSLLQDSTLLSLTSPRQLLWLSERMISTTLADSKYGCYADL